MPKKLTRDELLRRMLKRLDRMERDAIALGKEMAQFDEFPYTAERMVGDVQRASRDTWRLIQGEPI